MDIDVYEDQRPLVYEYIINRFGKEKTAFILSNGTMVDKGVIDCIGKALRITWAREQVKKNGVKHEKEIIDKNFGHFEEIDTSDNKSMLKRETKLLEDSFDNPYHLSKVKQIKTEYEQNPEYFKELRTNIDSSSLSPDSQVKINESLEYLEYLCKGLVK